VWQRTKKTQRATSKVLVFCMEKKKKRGGGGGGGLQKMVY